MGEALSLLSRQMHRLPSELLELYDPDGCGLEGLDRLNFDLIVVAHGLSALKPDNRKSAKERVAATLSSPSATALMAAYEARNG